MHHLNTDSSLFDAVLFDMNSTLSPCLPMCLQNTVGEKNTVAASYWLLYIFVIKWFERVSRWTPADCFQPSNVPHSQALTLEAFPSFLQLCSEERWLVICTSWVLLCTSLKQDKEAFNRNSLALYSFYSCFCHYHISALVLFPSQVLLIFSRSFKCLHPVPWQGLMNKSLLLCKQAIIFDSSPFRSVRETVN